LGTFDERMVAVEKEFDWLQSEAIHEYLNSSQLSDYSYSFYPLSLENHAFKFLSFLPTFLV
jgi:hypothetical protein